MNGVTTTPVTNKNRDKTTELISSKKAKKDKKDFIKDVRDFLIGVYNVNTTNNMIKDQNYFNNKNPDLDKVDFVKLTNIINNDNFKEKINKNKLPKLDNGISTANSLLINIYTYQTLIERFKSKLDSEIKQYLTVYIVKQIEDFRNKNITDYIKSKHERDINSYLIACNNFLNLIKEDKVLINGGMVQYINDFMKNQSANLSNKIEGFNKFIDEIPEIVTGKVTVFLVNKFETGIENRNFKITSLNRELKRIKQNITKALGTNNKVLNDNNIQTIKDALNRNNTNKGINVIIEQAESIIKENDEQKKQLIEQFNYLTGIYKEVLDKTKTINNKINKVSNSRLKASKSAFNKNKTELNNNIETKVLFSLQKKVKIYDATVNAFKKQAEQIIIKSKEIKNFATKTNGLKGLIKMNNGNIKKLIKSSNLNNKDLIKALQGVAKLIKNPQVSEVAHQGNKTHQHLNPGNRITWILTNGTK